MNDTEYTPPKGYQYTGAATFVPPPAWGDPPQPPSEIAKNIKENRILPAGDNVLIYHAIQEVTEGGIVIPDRFVEKNRNFQAWIIAVGPDAHSNGWTPGMLVRVSQFAGVILQKRDRESGKAGRSEKMDIIKQESILCRDWRQEDAI